MSRLAVRNRDARRLRARPKGSHDVLVKALWIVLPLVIGVLAAVLVVAPLLGRKEVSFVLAKDKVATAPERMKTADAIYRGLDGKGRPFSLQAGHAVQQSSKVPVVALEDLSARLTLDDGPAVLRAPQANYAMDRKMLEVDGALTYESADGYRLTTRNVGVDLDGRTIASRSAVTGRLPIGTFSGDRMSGDLDARSVVLEGRARLRIDQGAAKRR